MVPVEAASNDADCYRTTVPVTLKRYGLQTRLVIPGKQSPPAYAETVRAIQDALGKALDWNQLLINSEVETMAALAKQEGVTQRYIAHIIKLAFLAPDIMDAIFKGNIPELISLGLLKYELPGDWKLQRDMFGYNQVRC